MAVTWRYVVYVYHRLTVKLTATGGPSAIPGSSAALTVRTSFLCILTEECTVCWPYHPGLRSCRRIKPSRLLMHLHRGVESRYPFLTQLPSLMSLATLPIAFYQHEESTAQLDPTRHAHLCPHTVPQSVNPFAGYHTMLASQYNANVFVTTVMLGPLNTMRSLPGIAQSHILRPISLIVCILDCAALICALVLRLRLFLLQRRGRAEHFGEDFAMLRQLQHGDSSLYLHPPMMLIFSVMFLFAVELVGLIMTLCEPQVRWQDPLSWTSWETGVVWMAAGACLAYIAGTTGTAMCLGRHRRTIHLATADPQSVFEKV